MRRPTRIRSAVTHLIQTQSAILVKRDGRTICGPLCVPKSTYVTLAHKLKQKFFYVGCSLVRRFYCKKVNKNNNGTDGQTDRQSATQYGAPSYGGGPHKNNYRNLHNRPTLIHLFYLFNLFVKQMALDILRHSSSTSG